MRPNFLSVSLIAYCSMVVFFCAMHFYPPWSHQAYAQTTLEPDVQLLLIDKDHYLISFIRNKVSGREVLIRTSSDRGRTWTKAQILVKEEIGSEIEDFEISPVIVSDTVRLVARFPLQQGSDALLVIMTSDDFGVSWSSPKTVLVVENVSFLGCPTLDGQYNAKLRTLALVSTMNERGTGHIYVVSSRNGFHTWIATRLPGQIPTLCIEED